MFDRFTDRARIVLDLANEEAQRFNHEYVGTEHILLGLVKEGAGVGATVLRNLGIDLGRVRLEVEKLIKLGPETVYIGKLPRTPRAKKVIDGAIAAAQSLNHNYVGTEHVLLGLLHEYEGVAAQVLMNLGVVLEAVQLQVLTLVGAGKEGDRLVVPEAEPPRSLSQETIALIEAAIAEAAAMSSAKVEPEHVLLALLRNPRSAAAKSLSKAGVDIEHIRKRLRD